MKYSQEVHDLLFCHSGGNHSMQYQLLYLEIHASKSTETNCVNRTLHASKNVLIMK